MKRWIHLLWGVAVAAMGGHGAAPEAVRHDLLDRLRRSGLI